MKELSVMQMEDLNGGTWSWAGCGEAILYNGWALPATTIAGAVVIGAALCLFGGFGWS